MRIAMCASEVVPFAKTGGLADVVGALATALDKKGEEVIVVMPFYREAKKSGINPSIALGVDGERSRTIKTKKLKKDIYTATIGKNVKVYLIEKDEYFDRPYLYSEKTGDYPDNLERFSFYCRRTLELLKEIDFKPDIIHVHDWHASLIPVYLKTIFSGDRFYKDTKTVLTVHNLGYQGIFDKEKFPKIGLDWNMFTIRGLEYFDRINLLKAGLLFADIINTVSPTYSKEIQGEELGFGLEGVLRERNTSLFGILNGVDYSVWDPRTDKYIAKNYSAESLQGKAACKEDLEDICKLPHKKEIPIIGIVSRLASQKGFDILSEAVDEICRMQLQLVILGVGEEKYQMILKRAAGKYRKRISLHLEFNDPLAHKIYAGSD
ncbi:MAG: glycogen synthase, partial [Candidatus Omnitrophica bacterium]|nr:glycogen synthase [Candidatus Omnitrophota bacterium]